jgi:hypothetical protein
MCVADCASLQQVAKHELILPWMMSGSPSVMTSPASMAMSGWIPAGTACDQANMNAD